MAQYEWRVGGPKPAVEADVFGKVVERIAAGADLDGVKPEAIVEEAKSARSPIHKLFNWDDEDAADLYRRQQARHYLGALQIVRVQVSSGPTVSNRAFYSVKPRGYVSHQRVLSDRDLKASVIAGAKRELESYVAKYAGILALGTVIPRLQEVIDEMRDEIDRLAVDANARRSRTQSSDEPVEAPATAPM